MKLFGYFRSSAAYRVRIALNLKEIGVDQSPVNLLAAEALPSYRAQVNPQGLLPALITDEDGILVQSLAIIEYLQEIHPEPPLLPFDPSARAYVRAAAQMIACDIHPLANLRVLRHLKAELGQDQEQIDRWYRHWVRDGLERLEAFVRASGRAGRFLCGDTPGMADCCLVPQLFNARRFNCALDGLDTLLTIDARCGAIDAFQRAHPSLQPDAV